MSAVADERKRATAVATAGHRLHEGAWLCWLAASSVSVLMISNPLYLSLACLAGLIVFLSLPREGIGRAYGVLLKIGLAVALLSVPLNVLTGATGSTVLTHLPEVSFPDWLGGVTFGGDVTGESLVYSGCRALTLMALLIFVAAFNTGVNHFRLLRLAPAALFQAAVVVTVAVLLLPQGLAHGRAVREAQRLRGHRVRGLRSLTALAVPVLAGALERSIQRAESLDARGFGRLGPAPTVADYLAGGAGLAGILLAAAGGFAYFYYSDTPAMGLALLGGGLGLVAVALYGQGRRLQRTCFSQGRWSGTDRWVGGISLASLACLLALRLAGSGDLTYIPYPSLAVPSFHPAAAAAFLLLLAPLLTQVAAGGSRSPSPPAAASSTRGELQ